jgi:general stress protein 26
MSKLSVSDIAEKMGDIDYAMLSTQAGGGAIASRPMSNNGEIEYDGDNYFFAFESARSVQHITKDPHVGITFVGSKGLLGKPPAFIAVEATAELIRDKALFQEHWNAGIEAWAKDGIDTGGLVLIKARANRIHYWDGYEEEEVALRT